MAQLSHTDVRLFKMAGVKLIVANKASAATLLDLVRMDGSMGHVKVVGCDAMDEVIEAVLQPPGQDAVDGVDMGMMV